MQKNLKLTLLIINIILTTHLTFAQQTPFTSSVSNVGTTAAPFLAIGVGSRANAMGGAFSAIANDATALYWNPAGLNQCRHPEITINHSDWFLDIYHEFVGAVIPAGRHGFGVGVTYVGVPDQEVRTIEAPEGNGNFYNASDLMLGVSYAFQFTDQFSMGITGKFIRQQIYHSAGTALAVDLGALYHPSHIKWLSLGMQIANFGSSLRLSGQDVDIKVDDDPKHYSNDRLPASLDTDAFSLPLIFRFGLAMTPVNSRQHRFVTAIDLIHPSNNTESINVGAEYVFHDLISFRTGYHSLFERDFETTGGFTFGGGLQLYIQGVVIVLDYAYRDFGILNTVDRISCSIRF
ncbi:PorV/PorQ family protein [candidate division KSB1 bacterium]|nr:PorV/PorQ family protein [candidate division KSB1 bacterium]